MIPRYVNRGSTAGGNGLTNATTGANRAYASLPEAEAAEQVVQTDDYKFLCCGTIADARTTFDGWTPGSFRIYVEGNPDDVAGVHAGIWDTTKYHISAGSGTLPTLEIIEDNVTVSRIQLTSTNIDGAAVGRFGLIGLAFVADSLVLKGSGITSSSQGVAAGDTNNTNVKIKNCIAYDWQTGLYVRQQSAGAGDSFIVNNTVHSCNQGIRGQDNTSAAAYIQCWNNLSVGNTSDWVDSNSGFDLTNSGKNAFRNTGVACPGATDIDLSTYTDANIFVDAAADNFHLLTSGSAYSLIDNDGIGPASNAEVPTTDIDGHARSGTTTSVGADVIVSATTYNQSCAGALSFSGALVTSRTLPKSVEGALSFAGGLVKQAQKPLSGSINFEGTLLKNTSKVLSGSLSFSGALTSLRTLLKSVAGTLSFTGSVGTVRAILRSVSGSLSFASGVISKSTSKLVTGSLSFSGGLLKTTNKLVFGTLSFSGQLLKATFKNAAGVLTFTGTAVATLLGAAARGALTAILKVFPALRADAKADPALTGQPKNK